MSQRNREPLDRLTVVYGVVLALVIGVIEGDLTLGLAVLALNGCVALLAFFILPNLRGRKGLVRFLGITIPLLVFYLFYRETVLVLANPDIIWMDGQVARLEMGLWEGIKPERSSPALGEFLAFSYMAYVPLLLVAAALLMNWGRPGDRAAELMIRQICIVWGVCYVLFLLIPVTGPRFIFGNVQEARIGTGIFSAIAKLNQDHGMLRGAAFPSAHVAATTVVTCSMWRLGRKFFWALLPPCVAVAVGAVYLGYHYVVDVVAGIAVAILAIGLDRAVNRRNRARDVLPADRAAANGVEIR